MRWITATDLDQWANRHQAKSEFPRLVRRLIVALTSDREHLDVPAGESVYTEGWDGILKIKSGTEDIPSGSSVWELGTDADRKRKADADYKKRTANPGDIVLADTTYVFATLRRWSKGKKTWKKEKLQSSPWKNVVVLDADDIERMLEQAPSVSLQFAEVMGKYSGNLCSLTKFLSDWVGATDPPLPYNLVLAGRDENVEQFFEDLRSGPKSTKVRAHTRDEAIAFVGAALSDAGSAEAEDWLSRAVIAQDENEFEQLRHSNISCLIVPYADDIQNPNAAIHDGHHVLIPIGFSSPSSDAISLYHQDRHAFLEVLKTMAFDEVTTGSLATRCGSSLPALRRLLKHEEKPQWASDENCRTLVPAALAGAWVDDRARSRTDARPGDRAFLAALAGESYDTYAEKLTQILCSPDPPLARVGNFYKLLAPEDVFNFIAPYITDRHIEVLVDYGERLFGQRDPSLNFDIEERYKAPVFGCTFDHSGALRTGVLQTLALLTHHGDVFQVGTISTTLSEIGSRFVKRILDEAEPERWLSTSDVLASLAEVSPNAFLECVQQSLSHESPPLLALFEEGEGIGAPCQHSSLLWGLEALAWEPQYFPRACHLLAELAARDPGGRWANRPKNSLRAIFLPWRPCTFVGPEKRAEMLRAILSKYPGVGWGLCLELTPRMHDITSPTYMPHWMPVRGSSEEVDVTERNTNYDAILDLIERNLGNGVQRWKDIFDAHLAAWPPDRRARIFQKLIDKLDVNELDGDLLALRKAVRDYHHLLKRQNNVAESEENPVAQIAKRLEPSDALERNKWLFEGARPDIPGVSATDLQTVQTYRSTALKEIVHQYNHRGVFRLVEAGGDPLSVKDAAEAALDKANFDETVYEYLGEDCTDAVAGLLGAWVGSRHRQLGWAWTRRFTEQLRAGEMSPGAVARILVCLPCTSEVIEEITNSAGEVTEEYWQRVNPWNVEDLNYHDAAVLIKQKIDARLPHHAVTALAVWCRKWMRDEEVPRPPVSLMKEGLSKLAENVARERGGDLVVIHDVIDLFEALDLCQYISDEEIFYLEIPFIKIFRFNQRSRLAAHRLIAASGSNFAEIVRWGFKPEEEGRPDEDLEDDETVRIRAEVAFEVLHSCSLVPGIIEGGGVDEGELRKWMSEAETALQDLGRQRVGEQQIGEILANAPMGDDGVWPSEAVRNVVEAYSSSEIKQGLSIGIHNQRGATWRGMLEGGEQEKALQTKYVDWADKLNINWPETAEVLRDVAERYGEEAKRWDEEVRARRMR